VGVRWLAMLLKLSILQCLLLLLLLLLHEKTGIVLLGLHLRLLVDSLTKLSNNIWRTSALVPRLGPSRILLLLRELDL